MDRHALDQIVEHFAGKTGDHASTARYTRLPLLAAAIRKLCEHTQKSNENKYSKIANELPAIAARIGIDIDAELLEVPDDIAERIDTACKNLNRHVRVKFAPAFVEWLYVNDPEGLDSLLDQVGFDRQKIVQRRPGAFANIAAQGSAEFDMRELLRTAKTRVVLIAQNHWYLVSGERQRSYLFWQEFCQALVRGVDIDVVAMHPDVTSIGGRIGGSTDPEPDAVAVWSLYARGPQFPRQVEDCWSAFADWNVMYEELKEVSDSAVGNLRIFGAYFTPLTMTFIDPDDGHGLLVLSPRTTDGRSVTRPQFIVRKAVEPYAFGYYYGDVEHLLANEYWVKFYG
jgi:hypothetical protein